MLSLIRLFDALPTFKGKSRIERFIIELSSPKPMMTRFGFFMILDPREYTELELIKDSAPEPFTMLLINKLLSPSDHFVDIGAHVGTMSLLAAQVVGGSGKVVSVDPQPYNCNKILINAESNNYKNVVVVCAACGPPSESLTLYSQNETDKSRLTLAGTGVNDSEFKFVTSVMSLDYIVSQFSSDSRSITLKIDVEGYELMVLLSGLNAIACIDNIILEILPVCDPADVTQIVEILLDSGYNLFTVGGEQWSIGNFLPENNLWASKNKC